jgi:hypothetical protein
MTRTLPFVALCCALASGQAPPPAILTIEVENVVEYRGDISDPSKFGTSPNITPASGARVFSVNVALGDSCLSTASQPPVHTWRVRWRLL